MKEIVKTLENLPSIIRLILVIVYGLYGSLLRLFKSLAAKNIIGVILAIILIATGGLIVLWIYDIICVIQKKPLWWID